MAKDEFPIATDIDYINEILNDDGLDDLTLYEGYVVHWSYLNKGGKRISFAKYSSNDIGGDYTQNIEPLDEENGSFISHLQRDDMALVPAHAKIYWQVYVQETNPDSENGIAKFATCEVFAGKSCYADSIDDIDLS